MNWLKYSEIPDYFDCIMWLLTTELTNVKNKDGKTLMGLSNPIMQVTYIIPKVTVNMPEIKQGPPYWDNYTWLIKTYVNEHKENWFMPTNFILEEYYHFKMNTDKEEQYPPIPEFLKELYLLYKEN